MGLSRFIFLSTVIVMLVGLTSRVRAQDHADERGPTALQEETDRRARQHFLVGRSYFEEARFEDAAREFAEAYRLSGHSALLVNLGMAHERALQYEQAVDAYERYLGEADDEAEWADAARERASRLREILRSRTEATPAAEAPPARGLSSRQWWGVTALGVGAAAAVAALVTGLRARSLHNRLDAACVPNGICPEELAPDITQGRRLSVASWGTLAAALAASAVGLTLVWMKDDRGEQPRPAAEVSVGVAPGAAQASLRWRY